MDWRPNDCRGMSSARVTKRTSTTWEVVIRHGFLRMVKAPGTDVGLAKRRTGTTEESPLTARCQVKNSNHLRRMRINQYNRSNASRGEAGQLK